MALASDIDGEEYYQIAIGQGMYTSELSSAIPDGFCSVAYNMVATGDSLENRIGINVPSVTWRTIDVVPVISSSVSPNDYYFFKQIKPWGNNSALPAFGWGGYGYSLPTGSPLNPTTLSFVRAAGTVDGNDGFMSVTIPAACVGICQYNDIVYFSIMGQGVQKISAFNWATDSITYTQLPTTTTGGLRDIFIFKDRMWGFNQAFLYYTDLPTSGGQPETWAFATNRIPFVGPLGAGTILKVVPVGTKLCVFTTAGLFTLLVEGAPASWILRVLDSKSVSTASQCAFESSGIVYYINTKGVWATNALSVTKLSGVIEDQFFLAIGRRTHTIVSYEDGMIISIGKVVGEYYLDKDNCRVFYSKLDPIGWSQWGVNLYETSPSLDRLGYIWSTTEKIPTYLNNDPTVYVMAAFTRSTAAVPQAHTLGLYIFDGGNDKCYNIDGQLVNNDLWVYLKTRHFDGGNPYNLKYAKKGMLELFTSDTEHDFSSSWDNDATTGQPTEIRSKSTNDFTVGVGSNLIQLQADFHFRRASFNLRTFLQTDSSQIKVKDLAIAQDTNRTEFEQVR